MLRVSGHPCVAVRGVRDSASMTSMEAIWAKADRAAAKHKEKMIAREARQEERAKAAAVLGPAPKKKKHEKKITSTAEMRLQRNRMVQPGEEEMEGEAVQLRVILDDGSTTTYAAAVLEIQAYLRAQEQEVTLEEVRRELGIDLYQQDGTILETLRRHPNIESVVVGAGERLRYHPPFGIRNRSSLAYFLTHAEPSRDDHEPGVPRPVMRTEIKDAETYAGAGEDIDELIAQRLVARVEPTDKRHSDFVLCAMPPGCAASDEVRELWHAVRVPSSYKALHDELVKRKLRTSEDLQRRKSRKAAQLKEIEELRRKELEAKKKSRSGQVRAARNTHMQEADP